MKKDNLNNAKLYYNISKNIEIGLKYLENTDFSAIEDGKYEIDGNNVYALVQSYHSKPLEQGKFEAHRKYIDIQYIYSGQELMGFADLSEFDEATEYDEAKDIIFLSPKVDCKQEFVTLNAGCFVIFEPQDAHMPSLAVDCPNFVKKIVIKALK